LSTCAIVQMQAAWMARDMSRAADVLTPELQALLQKDCDRMRVEHRINRVERIAARATQVTEAWQERGSTTPPTSRARWSTAARWSL
jgi:hypothetical protein